MAGDGGFGSAPVGCVKSSRIDRPRVEGERVATAGKSPKDRAAREERERARLYRARSEFHSSVVRRRVRDNVIAGVAGGILVAAVLGGQIAYYMAEQGAPQPSPTGTPAPTGLPTPEATSPTPSPSASPTP